MSSVLGIDGAAEGAAAIVAYDDGNTVVAPWALRWGPNPGGSGLEVVLSDTRRIERAVVPHHGGVGVAVAEMVKRSSTSTRFLTPVPRAVAVEKQFSGKNPQVGIAVARTTGILLGATLVMYRPPGHAMWDVPQRFMLPATWRAGAGLPTTGGREALKAASLRDIPNLVMWTDDHLALLGERDDVTDAIGCGYVGLTFRAWEGSPEEFDDRLKIATGKATRSERREAAKARKRSAAEHVDGVPSRNVRRSRKAHAD